MTDHRRPTAQARRRLLAAVITGALVLAQLLLGAVSPAGACACGAFIDPADQRTGANVLRETAILSLEDGVETIIMGLALDGTRTGSTLLLPTPAVPEVSTASSGTLREMQAATAPREDVEYDLWGENPFLAGAGSGEGGAPPGGSGVTVHEQARVGDYQVAVLEGGADGVRTWLAENGYELAPAVSALLDPYAEDGWVFTAVRYAADAELRGEIEPLRVDFPSDELIYPMRLSRAASDRQELSLFVLSDQPVRRADGSAAHQHVERPWIADPTWEDWVWSDETLRELTGTAAAEASDGPAEETRNHIVTEFAISGDPETFTTDIVLVPDPEAEYVVPTVTVTETVTVGGVPVGWLLVAAAVITALALVLAALALRSARRARADPGIRRR
ncbi:DUF2330 domain-containing protein [Brachybacterium sp. J153]|uniref:DUF2330 domain-containing protein n=1 Tax=Brachybacterium sp. J153 TaxID=3116488 RepID=UPI002E76B36F|nr:DUF2330 domain-containing protein [Brachybacterium sp. J153]MEE1616853.1 DUF2330 domain-containing protein [Brachybacterium sp. J153]